MTGPSMSLLLLLALGPSRHPQRREIDGCGNRENLPGYVIQVTCVTSSLCAQPRPVIHPAPVSLTTFRSHCRPGRQKTVAGWVKRSECLRGGSGPNFI